MWARLESWQITQLQRLSNLDPERAELFLNTLWNSFPGLFEELAISAVDQEIISVEECSLKLDRSEYDVEQELLRFRKRSHQHDCAVIHDGDKNVARLAEGRVPVWEVVREYRKLGSVERLRQSFPGIAEGELAAALRYAEANTEEIEDLIGQYEDVLARRRAEYPFSK